MVINYGILARKAFINNLATLYMPFLLMAENGNS
jgi:hypothetical protein